MLRIIVGQTASGKNTLAFRIARQSDYEIISVDSMKIYRGMDIGTSKQNAEQRKKIRYHLIDIIESYEEYNVAKFVSDCDRTIVDIIKRGKKPLLVCGTPLYLKAVLYGIFSGSGTDSKVRAELEKISSEQGLVFLYEQLIKVDPAKAGKIHPNDRKRIIRALEVIGYKEVVRHLNGEITLEAAKEEVKKGTRYLARKQMTWFRKFPDIKWIECLHADRRGNPGDDADRIYKVMIESLE